METLLAIDCSASLCAACVYDAGVGKELGRSVRDLGKGHAEHLMAVIAEALEMGGVGYADLDAVAVSTGPGSFTGVRVGVSTARGLALALKIPAIGVTTLEALAYEARRQFPGRAVLAAMDAGRDEFHAAFYDGAGTAVHAPAIATLREMQEMATTHRPVLAGTAAQKIAADDNRFDLGPIAATADVAAYARLALEKDATEKPHPVYLRAADAKPQAGFALPRAS